MPLLDVAGLTVELRTHRGWVRAVNDIGFTLDRGETVGLVGESGCGKSMTALAIMGLLPDNARVSGSLRFDGDDLPTMSERERCAMRGNRMAMVFQEPMTALNPVHTVGRQIGECMRLHGRLPRAEARDKAIALLDRVGIADAARRIDAYPHQFSGGQRQRVTIAMALACGPDLLIADEPTTALDVTIQRQILDLVRDLVAERGMALLLISHDLGVIAQNVRRMMVMYGGRIVESGMAKAVFRDRAHPYTRGLFAARPSLTAPRGGRLATIGGTVPDLADLPPGCPFAGRCAFTIAACNDGMPPAVALGPQHEARCIRLREVEAAAKAGATA